MTYSCTIRQSVMLLLVLLFGVVGYSVLSSGSMAVGGVNVVHQYETVQDYADEAARSLRGVDSRGLTPEEAARKQAAKDAARLQEQARKDDKKAKKKKGKAAKAAKAADAGGALVEEQAALESITPGPTSPLLLFFKYSRTGSTWLDWTLDTLHDKLGRPWSHSHEAQQCFPKKRNKFDRYVVGAALGDASIGTSKCRPSKCCTPFELDRSRLAVVGLSLACNRLSQRDLSLDRWVPAVTNATASGGRIIVATLVRTNLVKRAISAIAVEEQKKVCGHKKIPSGEQGQECLKDLSDTLTVPLRALQENIYLSSAYMQHTVALANGVAKAAGRPEGALLLRYEALQLDLAGGVRRFLHDADVSLQEPLQLSADAVSLKRGDDDLSKYLDNFDELDRALADYPCLQRMLHAVDPVVFEDECVGEIPEEWRPRKCEHDCDLMDFPALVDV